MDDLNNVFEIERERRQMILRRLNKERKKALYQVHNVVIVFFMLDLLMIIAICWKRIKEVNSKKPNNRYLELCIWWVSYLIFTIMLQCCLVMSYKNMYGIYAIVAALTVNYFGFLILMFKAMRMKQKPFKIEMVVTFI